MERAIPGNGIRAALLLLLLPWPVLWAHPAQAAETPAAYAARLAAALSAVQDARQSSGTARLHALAAARALLPATVPVRAGAMLIQARLGAVRRDLNAGRLASAEQRLSALRAAVAAPSAGVAPPNARHLAALDTILRGPPFTTPPDLWTSISDFLQRSPLGALLDLLRRLWNSLLGSASDSPLVPIVAGVIAAAALLFAVSRLFGRVVPQAGVAEEAENPLLTRLDAPAARQRAEALAASGQYREAARYTFLSTLLALDEAGRLRIDEATGNRDLLRQARATPLLAEALAPVVRGFDLFWFGHAPVNREEYERYRRLNERALQAAR